MDRSIQDPRLRRLLDAQDAGEIGNPRVKALDEISGETYRAHKTPSDPIPAFESQDYSRNSPDFRGNPYDKATAQDRRYLHMHPADDVIGNFVRQFGEEQTQRDTDAHNDPSRIHARGFGRRGAPMLRPRPTGNENFTEDFKRRERATGSRRVPDEEEGY